MWLNERESPVTTRPVAGVPPAWGPLVAAVLGVLAAAGGTAISWSDRPYPAWLWLPAQLAGVSFTIAGAVLWLRRPANPSGRLMTLVGITWYIGTLQTVDQPVLFAVGFCFYYTSSQVLAHLAVALPAGRLTSRPQRLVIVGQYVLGLATQIGRYCAEHPRQPNFWSDPQAKVSVWADAGSVVNIVAILLVSALVIHRWWVAGPPVRREYGLVWGTLAAMGALSGVLSLAFLTRSATRPYLALGFSAVLLAFSLGLLIMPVAIAAGLLRVRMARLRVAELVVRLAATAEPAQVQAALAEALEDPSLRVYFRLPDPRLPDPCPPDPLLLDLRAGDARLPDPDAGYVDAAGRPARLPAAGDRAVTPVTWPGGQLAVLAHDPALAGQRGLVDAVVAAARLALENAHLQAAQRAQLKEVLQSRTRIVVAADNERRRIQRDLHDGVQHTLLGAAVLVERARQAGDGQGGQLLDRAGTQLRQVIQELRELTEGVYPPALTEQGLAAAVDGLAERAPLPVTVDVPGRRWPEHIERSAYFVVTEALSNVYKHAGAGRAWVRVAGGDGLLTVEVGDDGTGGADDRRGTGLRGLVDRVTAHNGRLVVDSPAASGTRVRAELPCA